MFQMATPAMIMMPSVSYHTSIDGMDRIDPHVLRRNGIIAGTYLYFIAAAGGADILWLAGEVQKHASRVLKDKEKESKGTCFIHRRAFHQAFLSLKTLADAQDDWVHQRIEETAAAIAAGPMPSEYLPADQCLKAGGERIPERQIMGCLTFSQLSKEALRQSKWRPAWNHKLNIPLFWCDGKRTLWEVSCLSALELGRVDAEVYFNETLEYFMFLEQQDIIKFK